MSGNDLNDDLNEINATLGDVAEQWYDNVLQENADLFGQVQQLQQQVATYQGRETHFAGIMEQQSSELKRLQDQLSAVNLDANNSKKENVDLVHRVVGLEGELAELRKKLALREEQLRQAHEALGKQSNTTKNIVAVMEAACGRIKRDAETALVVVRAATAEPAQPSTSQQQQQQPQYVILVETPPQP